MSENKRYYWLKLNENFFEDHTIEWIEEQDGGEKYALFYLKLCLKSLKDDGILIRYVGEKLIPYDIKALARLTNTDKDTVDVALELFTRIGLIERKDTGEIYMKQINEMIGTETHYAVQKRRQRALDNRKKELSGQCPDNVLECPPEIEKELDKEIELDIEKEIKDRKKPDPIPYQEIVDLFNEICTESPKVTTISKKRKEKIAQRYKELGDIETFRKAFNKVSESDFLTGKSKESWIVKFDWIMENDTNILKVLEGNYKNKPKRNHEGREIDDSVEIDF